GPSSTTTGVPVVGTTCATVAATAGEVGVAAPIMRGLRTALPRKVRYSLTLFPSPVPPGRAVAVRREGASGRERCGLAVTLLLGCAVRTAERARSWRMRRCAHERARGWWRPSVQPGPDTGCAAPGGRGPAP